jgi:predicted O-methyltransferase YrrM
MLKKIKILTETIVGNKQQKYESRHILLSYLSGKSGFRLGNKNLLWHKDSEFKNVYSLIKADKERVNIPERKFVLYSIAKSIVHIQGDIVECGVYMGESSFLMLKANEHTNKNFYGFDSFEGLSEPEENDIINNEYTFKWKKNDLSVSENIAFNNLKLFENRFELYKGWIPEKFHKVENKNFSMIHIDVDLYQPTLDSIEFFWDKLNVGGVLVCDDYGFETCPGAKKAMDDFFSKKNMSVIHLPTGQGVVFKQKVN